MVPSDDGTKSHEDRLRRLLTALFDSQQLAVLATLRDGQPYCSLVGVAVSENLQDLLFATTRSTRKFENISADNRVALAVKCIPARGGAAEILLRNRFQRD